MTDLEDLEARLGRLDLQLESSGDHVSDERLAVIVGGGEPTRAEAGHLAGCDECVDLLIGLGEGLEALAEEQPALGALLAEAPRPPKTRRASRATVVALLVIAGAAAAAAGYLIRAAGPGVAPSDRGAVEAADGATDGAADGATAEVPILPAEQVVGRAPVDGAAVLARIAAVLGRAWAPVAPVELPIEPSEQPIEPSELPIEPGDDAAEAPADAPREAIAGRPSRRPTRPALGALDRRDGPRPLERLPVDGPPRGFGHLQLNTRPPARVFVDGVERGWTPIIDLRLAEGPHDVKLVFESPLAAEKEQRFRVLIEPNGTWRMTRDNVKRTPR